MYFKRIQELRFFSKYSKKEVALYLGVSVESYRRLESGKRELRISELCKLADYYDVTADYILELSSKKEVQ